MVNAYATKTRAMAVSVKGKITQESYFKLAPDPLNSGATYRLLLAAAYGRILEDSLIRNFDEPVSKYLPSWNQTLKKAVTVSHLLNGSSGILFDPDDPDEYNPRDAFRFAEASILVSAPGMAYQPCTKELWLLTAILKEITRIDPEKYITENFLLPLEIKDYKFNKDSAGNITGIDVVAGQWIHLGEMFLSAGKYKEKKVLSPLFCKKAFAAQSETGQSLLGMELVFDTTFAVIDDEFISQISAAGLDPKIVASFKKIKGKYAGTKIPVKVWERAFGNDYEQILRNQVLPIWPNPFNLLRTGKCRGAILSGRQGEQYFLDQKTGTCAVRFPFPSDQIPAMKDQWFDFYVDVLNTVK